MSWFSSIDNSRRVTADALRAGDHHQSGGLGPRPPAQVLGGHLGLRRPLAPHWLRVLQHGRQRVRLHRWVGWWWTISWTFSFQLTWMSLLCPLLTLTARKPRTWSTWLEGSKSLLQTKDQTPFCLKIHSFVIFCMAEDHLLITFESYKSCQKCEDVVHPCNGVVLSIQTILHLLKFEQLDI